MCSLRLFSVFTSPWSELKIVTIQWIKSRIWDTIDDWCINNLAKNQISAVFHLHVICKSVSPKFIELCMETPCWNICHWVLLLKRKIIALELRHIERNVSSSASTVQLAKTKVITHLLTYAIASSCHATQKLGNSNVLNYNNKYPVELKHCETLSSCRVFYLTNLKPEKER